MFRERTVAGDLSVAGRLGRANFYRTDRTLLLGAAYTDIQNRGEESGMSVMELGQKLVALVNAGRQGEQAAVNECYADNIISIEGGAVTRCLRALKVLRPFAANTSGGTTAMRFMAPKHLVLILATVKISLLLGL